MKCLQTFLILCLLAGFVTAPNPGQCEIDANIDWENNVLDNGEINDVDTLDKSFTYTGELTVDPSAITNPYITVTAADGVLSFKTTDAFKNFDLDTPRQPRDLIQISVSVPLQCSAGTTNLVFIQSVRDTNNHDPAFGKPSYELVVPMPILPKINIVTLGVDSIIATDIDFSNQDITVDIEPKGNFVLDRVPTEDNSKSYEIAIRVSKATRITEDTTFTLTATDSAGKPGTAALTIVVDTDSSLPNPPKFSSPAYSFQYSLVDGVPKLTPQSGAVKVVSDVLDKVYVRIQTNEYFTTTFDNTNGVVTIDLVPDVEIPDTQSTMDLSLSATITATTDSTTTVILVHFPEKVVVNPPKFSQPFYNAIYSTDTEPHQVTVEGDITVTGEAVVAIVDGDGHFKLTQNGDHWELSVAEDLPEDVLKAGQDITLTLEATATGEGSEGVETGTAVIIVHLPEVILPAIPKFSKTSYAAQYSVDNMEVASVQILDGPIVISNDVDVSLTVNLIDSYTDYFQLTCVYATKTCEISVTQNLGADVVDNNVNIILTAQASVDEAADVGIATIVLAMPVKEEIIAPSFSEKYYVFNYVRTVDGLDLIEAANGNIAVISDHLDKVIVEIFGQYVDNFAINCDGTGACTLTVTADLTDDVLDGNHEIVLSATASLTETPEYQGTTAIVIKLPEPIVIPSPKFSNVLYTAQYLVEGGQHSVVMDPSDQIIQITNHDPIEITLTSTGNHAENFQLTVEGDYYILSIAEDLGDDVLKTETQLVLTLDASAEGAVEHGFANIVIKLPVIPPEDPLVPTFSNIAYTASYTVAQDEPDTVTLVDAIAITSDRADETVVSVTGTFSSNFAASLVDGSWQITVTTDLEGTTLASEKEVIVTLEATVPEVTITGTSAVVIKLPLGYLAPAPKFSKIYYTGSYSVNENGDGLVTMDPDSPIETPGDLPVNIMISGNYAENFALDLVEGVWTVSVPTPLDQAVLDSESELYFELTAVADGTLDNGYSTLVITLPPKISIAFDKPYYMATYVVNEDGTDSVTNDETIALSAVPESIVISEDYATYFSIICSPENTCLFGVTGDLTEDILKSEIEILVTLEAKKAGVEDSAFATILVSLPLRDNVKVPQFSKTIYTATYTQGVDSAQVALDNGPIQIEGEEATVTVVTIDGTNHEFFTVTEDGQLALVDGASLPDAVVNGQNSIILQLLGTSPNSRVQGSAMLVVQLPKKVAPTPFTFSSIIYSAIYNVGQDEPRKDTVTVDGPISIMGGDIATAAISVSLGGEYASYFDEPAYDAGTVTLNLHENFPQDILDTNSVITVSIDAKIEETGALISSALVIKLPLEVVASPIAFSEVSYVAKYTIGPAENDDSIALEGDGQIQITGTNLDQVTIAPAGPYSEFFQAAYDGISGVVTVTLKSDVTEDILNTNTVLSVTLEATLGDSSTKVNAALVVRLPPERVANPITFTAASYLATYVKGIDGAQDSITIEGDFLEITGRNLDQVVVTISGDYQGDFNDPIYDEAGKITVTLKTNLPDEAFDKTVLALTVQAEIAATNTKISAALVVELPPKPVVSPISFDALVYTAQYNLGGDSGDTITPDADIQLVGENLDQVTVSISGEYASYFENPTADGTGLLSIQLSSNLPPEVLDANTIISVTLDANFEDFTVTAAVVVKLPLKVVTSPVNFDSIVYTAQYNWASDTNDDSITLDGDIVIVGENLDQLTFMVTGDYAGNFNKPIIDGEGKVTVTLASDLPQEVLADNTVVTVTIEASTPQPVITISSALVVRLPPKVVTSPINFNSVSYVADYTAGPDPDDDSIAVNGDIVIEGANLDQLTFSVDGDYALNFNPPIKDGDGKVTITLKSDLPQDVLETNTVITVTINAVTANPITTVSAALVVKLPPKVVTSPVTFTSLSYIANYVAGPDSNDDTVIPDVDIVITGKIDQVTLKLVGDYADNFEIPTVDREGKVTIALASDLGQEILDTNTVITVSIETVPEDPVATVSAVVVVKLPVKVVTSPISFTSVSYIATYNAGPESNDDTVTPDGDIVISGENLDQLTLRFAGDYRTNFNTPDIDSEGKVTVTLASDFSQDVLDSNTVITVTIEAVTAEPVTTVSAALVVKLPVKVVTSPISFTSVSYIATYNAGPESNDDSVTPDGDIVISGENLDQLTLRVAGDYRNNFNIPIIDGEGKVTVTLASDFSQDVLDSNTVITVTIEAVTAVPVTTVSAVLVVKLPVKVVTSPISFTSVSYIATYNAGPESNDDTITLDGDIVISGENLDQLTLRVAGELSSNFNSPTIDGDGKVAVTLASDLAQGVLDASTVITVTIEAITKEPVTTVAAALVVKLPLKVATPPVTFNSISYLASYSAGPDTNDDAIVMNSAIVISGENLDQLNLMIAGDYSSNFNTPTVDGDGKVTVTLRTDLPQNVLDTSTVLTVTIQAITPEPVTTVSAALIVKLPLKVVSSPVNFDNIAYTAVYNVGTGNNDDTIAIDGDIVILGILDQVTLSITGDLSSNFNPPTLDGDGKVMVTLATDLPQDVLDRNTVITVTINVVTGEDNPKISAALIVKLPLNLPIAFSDVSYSGTYTKNSEGGLDSLTVEGDILVSGENLVSVSLTGDLSSNFRAELEESTGTVSVTLLQNLPADVLHDNTVVTLTLEAVTTNPNYRISAALVIKLPPRIIANIINFESAAYTADYKLASGDDEEDSITLNGPISITGQSLDRVHVSLTGDLSDHFDDPQYDPATGVVTISLDSSLPKNVVDDNSVLTFTLQATLQDSDVSISSALVVKLPRASTGGGDGGDNDGQVTGLIAATSVLAVLLVGFIVGSAIFYYVRRKRDSRRSYADIAEPESSTSGTNPSPGFQKNPHMSEMRAVDHPVRRATTGVRYSIRDEDGPMETNTEEDDSKDARRAVAFDENVEKLEIESTKDDEEENDSRIDIESDEESGDSSSEEDNEHQGGDDDERGDEHHGDDDDDDGVIERTEL